MRNGSARCLTPIEKPLRPVCAPSSSHPRENSTAVRAAFWQPSRGSISTSPPTVRDVEFLRANIDRMIKITIPGPVYDVAPGQERPTRTRKSWSGITLRRSATPRRSGDMISLGEP